MYLFIKYCVYYLCSYWTRTMGYSVGNWTGLHTVHSIGELLNPLYTEHLMCAWIFLLGLLAFLHIQIPATLLDQFSLRLKVDLISQKMKILCEINRN